MTRASKVLPPSIPPWSIPRPALEVQLDEALTHRLTTVTAGAGFGKSTLLATWAARRPFAWYTIDENDRELDALAAGLVQALGARVTGLPEDAAQGLAVPRGGRQDPVGQARALAGHLSEELEPLLGHEFVLVLDDMHELARGSPPARLIESLCRNAPNRLHLVLSSRESPPFAIERLRGQGQVLALDASLLRFSIEEVNALLAVNLPHAPPDLAASLHQLTGGWPAALRLAIESLRTVAPDGISGVLAALQRPGGPLFDYLAKETLGGADPAVRDLLRGVAPFDRFTVELCEVLRIEGAAHTLSDLIARGLFVDVLGGSDGWFALHRLIRDFVRQAWPLTKSERRRLHLRAAKWFQARDCLAEALACVATSYDTRAMARLLAEKGEDLIARGALRGVIRVAEMLPAELRDAETEQVIGEAYGLSGDYATALQCYERAAGHAAELPPGLAWRIGVIHAARGDLERAFQTLQRGTVDGSQPRDEAVLLAQLADRHLMAGEKEPWRELSTRALDAANRSHDARALAVVHSSFMLEAGLSDFRAATNHYRSALEAAERAGDVPLMSGIRMNRAAHLNEQGAYHEAFGELDSALRLCELAGYTVRIAAVLTNRGETQFHLGRLEEALTDFSAAKALFRRIGSPYAQWPLAHEGIALRDRGDLALAGASTDEALALAEQTHDAQALILACGNLAALRAAEDPAKAERLADRAIEVARSWPVLQVWARVQAGWVALARGDGDRAADLATEAARLARERENRPDIALSLELAALTSGEPPRQRGRLEDAIAIWCDLGNSLAAARAELALSRLSEDPAGRARGVTAERRLRALGVRLDGAGGAAGLLACLPRESPAPVWIRTLGGFRVLHHGKPVKLSAWRSKKARDLLKILIARRGRPTPRDVLMDALWPDEPADQLGKRLSVLLATTRTVLDPDRRFPSDHFLAADDAAIRLALENIPVDVEHFLAEAEAGLSFLREGRAEEARPVLALAEESYTGEFLEEDLYEDWAAPLREETRARYVAVVRALAKASFEAGELDQAIRYRLRTLQRDPYDEEAHLGLIAILRQAGRPGEALRAYRTYVSKMDELEVEPAPFPDLRKPAPA
jgi:ATP/maltotriose-dependent transcriptional regulator MalT